MKIRTKLAIWLFVIFIISVILHNFLSALIGLEEPVFYVIALLSGFGFAVVVVYSIIASIIRLIKKSQ